MAKKSYSLDQFRVSRDTGLMYNHPKYGWMGADPAQTKWYNQQTGIVTPKKVTSPKTPSLRKQRIDYVKGKYGKYFSAGTKFTSEQGHLDRYKPMSLKGGTNSNYNWVRAYYYDSNGKTQRTSDKRIWC